MRSFIFCCLLLTAGLWQQAYAADPTQPPGWLSGATPIKKQVAAPARFNLQQVLNRNGHRLAVINNQLVKTGDRVAGAKVVAIRADSVVLNISQKRLTLSLLDRTNVSVRRSDNRK